MLPSLYAACFETKATNVSGFLWGNASWCGQNVQPGDEIGAFVAGVAVNNGCVGRFVVNTAGSYGAMPVYNDDATTTEKDGVTNGDVVFFKICRNGVIMGFEQTLVWSSNYNNDLVQLNLAASQPTAAFTVDHNTGCFPLTVTFTNNSVGTGDYWWDFGDGGTSEEKNPVHTYNAAGVYNACLTVINACGENQICMDITVGEAPTADYTILTNEPYCVEQEISFRDNSGNNITSWEWDFGDGTISNQQNPSHLYTNSGTYEVCLTVNNSCGASTYCNSVFINALPVADFEVNGPYCTGESICFDGHLSSNATNWQWNFGDGGTSTEPVLCHVYNQAGTYSISLTVSNDCGSDTKSYQITVEDVPVAEFTVDPNPVCINKPVNFNNLSTTDVDTLVWEFGDGQTSTEPNPSHTYTAGGTYSVCLSLTNDCSSDRKCLTLTVLEPGVEIHAYPQEGCAPPEVAPPEVAFESEINPCISTPEYLWNFDDGTSSEQANPTHTYTNPGNYWVQLTVTDGVTGQKVSHGLNVKVAPFCYTQTGPSLFVWGTVEAGGAELEPGDWVGAFVDGVSVNDGCVGGFEITTQGSYGSMAVYGDDPTTVSVKDGAVAGDTISFKAWDASEARYIDLCGSGPNDPIWTVSGDLLEINLSDACGQIIPLVKGWNLISVQVNKCYYVGARPTAFLPAGVVEENVSSLKTWLSTVIKDAVNPDTPGDWQRVTSFDKDGAHIMDKGLPDVINTLKYISVGYGYWVKMNNPGQLVLEGQFISGGTSLILKKGWNLIGYIPHDISYADIAIEQVCPYTKGVYTTEEGIEYCFVNPLATLTLASINGKFRRVTSFDSCKGAMIYDITLPSAINTLHYIGPKYGYWIKIETENEVELTFPAQCSDID